jgi:hypothetical protein
MTHSPPGLDDNTQPERTATTADMADLLIAHINIWTALDAICRDLPPGGAAQRQLELSRQGMTDALASIVRRHAMNITWESGTDEQRDTDPA